MTLGDDDLHRIQRLRERFLDASADAAPDSALGDYWRDRRDVAAYDRVLGARIGWKWDAALDELAERGFAPAAGETVLDFGCGAGVAARRFAHRFGGGELLLHDRSPHAMAFAVERLRLDLPGIAARALPKVGALQPDVLLVSHVLSELDGEGLAALRALAGRSRRVVIVEPGNRPTARRLQQLRDELLAAGQHHVVAPCLHQAHCPALQITDEWCHLFATPPPEVFTDGFWARAGKQLGIDLRSLPYSFVALAAGPAPTADTAPAQRPLGRAGLTPHEARVRTCSADGLGERVVTKRREAALWRALKKRPEQVRRLLGDRPSPGGDSA